MDFHHRKLVFESLDMNSTGKTCSTYYCNPKQNPSEICPLSCLYICYPNCSFPLFSEIQPPLPPNFFTPKILLPPSPHRITISIFLIILISFLATSFFVFCCFTVYRFRNSRILSQGQQQEEEEEEFSDIVDEDFHGPMVDHPIWYIRTVGLQPSVINAITICKYKRGEGLVEGTDCSVCLSEFQEDESIRILPKCSHAFHIPCIDTWLRSHTNCPMCRAGIVITTIAPSPSPEQNLGLRHDEETRSENGAELRIEIENEDDSADISSMDASGNSKEDMGNGNEGELSEFYASRISASSESLSTAFMTRIASTDANSSRQQSTDQNSLEVNDSEMDISVSQSSFGGNESSAEKRNFCVDRVMEKEQIRSLSFRTKVVMRRSQSAALLSIRSLRLM